MNINTILQASFQNNNYDIAINVDENLQKCVHSLLRDISSTNNLKIQIPTSLQYIANILRLILHMDLLET